MYELKVVVVVMMVVVVVVVLHHPSSLSSQFLFSLVRDAHHPSPSLTIPHHPSPSLTIPHPSVFWFS